MTVVFSGFRRAKRKHLFSKSTTSEMVQNLQIPHSFTVNDFILVHEYIHSHPNSHSTTYFLVTNIFIPREDKGDREGILHTHSIP